MAISGSSPNLDGRPTQAEQVHATLAKTVDTITSTIASSASGTAGFPAKGSTADKANQALLAQRQPELVQALMNTKRLLPATVYSTLNVQNFISADLLAQIAAVSAQQTTLGGGPQLGAADQLNALYTSAVNNAMASGKVSAAAILAAMS